MYDSEDTEDDPLERALAAYVEDYNFDVPQGMELMAYNRRRPDGGEARSVDTVDMVPMCRTVSGVTRITPNESSDTSGTDTAEINGSDIEDFGQWPDLSDEKDYFGSDVGFTAVFEFTVGYGYDDAISNRDQNAGLEPCAEGDNVHRRPSVFHGYAHTAGRLCPAGRISPSLIGHRASVGGSVGCADWSCMDGAVDILWYGLGLAGWISGVVTADLRALDHGCGRSLGGGQSCGFHVWS